MKLSGLYIHIPFCKSKCFYCDFFSVALLERKAEWLDALLLELKTEPVFLSTGKPALRTIYFGGGTPSLLTQEDFDRIFSVIEEYYDLSFCEEVTVEANPDDLNIQYLLMLRNLPVNRLSIGIQTLNDSELKAINRRHTAEEAILVLQNCEKLNFDNVSIDLMYGLPLQTFESFQKTLRKALALPIKHISSYALSWEEGSVLFRKLQKGELQPAADELLEACYFELIDKLEAAGFYQYELSNFAREGYHSRHNSSYWDGTHYLGVGPGAHSYNGAFRRYNRPSLDEYFSGICHDSPFREIEKMEEDSSYNDFIITRMRTLKGLDLNELVELFGLEKQRYCLRNAAKNLKNGTLLLNGSRLQLARKGFFISDMILSELLYV
jgi:putative oxygen-independent coproporphyrinogen III oxidase